MEEKENSLQEEVNNMIKAEKEMNIKAEEYVWNILNFGPTYSHDEFERIKKEKASKDAFTDFSSPEIMLNMTMLIQGYGNFGRAFIEAVFNNDKDSCINMFESVTQEYLELDNAVQQHLSQLEEKLKDINTNN